MMFWRRLACAVIALFGLVLAMSGHAFAQNDPNGHYVTVSVSMVDGGAIPSGLTWELSAPTAPAWTLLDSGSVPAGGTWFETTTTVAIPDGSYNLYVTGGGYSSGQVVVIDGADVRHDFVLDRLMASVSFTVATSSGADVPAGTTWALFDGGDQSVASGTLSAALPSGAVWGPESIERGVYTLSVNAPGFDPFSTTVDVTNSWVSDFNVDVLLQEPMSTITFTVSMSDAGLLPNGLEWSLVPSGSWEALASGSVTPGVATFWGEVESGLPYGAYQLWITGNGYSSGQVLNVQGAATHHDFVLDRLTATADVTVSTTDGRDIPAGTVFTFTDSQGTEVDSFSIDTALASPQTLDQMTLAFDSYTLAIDAPGFYPLTVAMPVTDPWTNEYHFTAELQPILSTVSFTVSMSDGGPLPYGLEWALNPGYSGDVTPGGTLFEYTIDEPVELGTYALWVTGNGYSSGQVLSVTGPETHHDVVLDRLTGDLTVTLTTSDEGEIPVGTTWELLDAGGNVVQSGVLDQAIPNGGTLPLENPIEFGVYTLNMNPGGPDGVVPLAVLAAPREILPFSMTIDLTNPWVRDYSATADLQIAPTESAVSFSVRMSDDGPLPNGLIVSLIPDGTWDPFSTVDVPAGEARFDGAIDEPVPFGTYSIWVAGNGYSSGQVLNIQTEETHHDFVLDRLTGAVTITLVTSDEADIPAGTSWSIADSAGTVYEEGTLASPIASGDTLPVVNPFEFDVYTLTIEAEGYHPFSMELPVTNPWTSEFAFTANLVSSALPEPPVTPTPEPTGTPTQEPTPAPTQEPTGTPGVTVTELPKTGQGSQSGTSPNAMLLAAASLVVLAGAGGIWAHGKRRV